VFEICRDGENIRDMRYMIDIKDISRNLLFILFI